jgi:putative endonuclease
MEIRKYFYKDNQGVTQKYIYCIRGCPEPYTQNQVGLDIVKVSRMGYICKKCSKELNISDELPKSFDRQSVEKYEEVESTKSSVWPQIEEHTTQIETETLEKVEEVVLQPIQNFFAYVVKCKDGTFCSGVTTNLENAVKNHNSGSGSVYTKPKERRPVVLVTSQNASSIDEAKKIKAEFQKNINDGHNYGV